MEAQETDSRSLLLTNDRRAQGWLGRADEFGPTCSRCLPWLKQEDISKVRNKRNVYLLFQSFPLSVDPAVTCRHFFTLLLLRNWWVPVSIGLHPFGSFS